MNRSLAGEWACRLDPDNRGRSEKWYQGKTDERAARLPGTTQTNLLGPGPSKMLISNLTPSTEYFGPAWYQRDIMLSDDDCSRHIELFMERVGWVSEVWLNGIRVGSRDSLVSPHVYHLGKVATSGRNRLTILIDNSNRKADAAVSRADGSESEDLVLEHDSLKRLNCGGHHAVFGGGCFNGITGRFELQLRPKVRVKDLQIYPDVAGRKVRVALQCANDTRQPCDGKLVVKVRDVESGDVVISRESSITCLPRGLSTDVSLSVRDKVRPWDEFDPHVYELSAELRTTHGSDTATTDFGMRELSQVGTQLAINGRPTFLRGALEKFVHPITGYPPTDMDYWLRIWGVNKAHGLNHVRFHCCCPPEAAFAAADRLGMILNVELPGCSGSEPDDADTLDYLQEEAFRILRTFGNHPSFCMLTMGNELLYGDEERKRCQPVLMERVAKCREQDGRHWYCCTAHPHTDGRDDDFYLSAWPEGGRWGSAESEGAPITGIRWSGFDVVDSSRFDTQPPETASDYGEGIAGIDKPVITHEVGQWAVYPDIREAERYTGVMKPYNLEIIRDFMEEKGTLDRIGDFVNASGELSLLLYKEEIESAMRTPGLAGFQLLGFHDHPPQGTSTIGIVTALRDSKGIVTPEDFSRYCGPTVPLARLTRRTFTSDETLTADVDVAHYGPADLKDATVEWRLLTSSGDEVAAGSLDASSIPTGGLIRVGRIETPLSAADTPARAVLEISIKSAPARNSWDLWVYPRAGELPAGGVAWRDRWDPQIADEVSAGATAILQLPADQIPGATRGCFTSVFWNPIMKRHQKSFTMGVLCDPAHPALAQYPTESHSNWQWWDVLRPSRVLDLDGLQPRPDSIVRMIDSFIGNRCLSVVFEAKLGKGKLLVTSLDLSSDLDSRHAARQLRRSIEEYVSSDSFAPRVEIGAGDVDRLIAAHRDEPKRETREEVKARFDRLM